VTSLQFHKAAFLHSLYLRIVVELGRVVGLGGFCDSSSPDDDKKGR